MVSVFSVYHGLTDKTTKYFYITSLHYNHEDS